MGIPGSSCHSEQVAGTGRGADARPEGSRHPGTALVIPAVVIGLVATVLAFAEPFAEDAVAEVPVSQGAAIARR